MEENQGRFKVIDKRRFDESGNERIITEPQEGEQSQSPTQPSDQSSAGAQRSGSSQTDQEQTQPKNVTQSTEANQSNLRLESTGLNQQIESDEKISEGYDRSNGGTERNISFASFVLSLTYQTLVHLGEVSGVPAAAVDLEAARNTIDVLDILKEKTKGNLTAEEQELLDNTVRSLKFKYIEVMNRFQTKKV